MPDREKVINALGRCESYGYCEDMDCPYYKNTNCLELLRKEALTLLKEKEPKPITITTNEYGMKFYHCPNCNKTFYEPWELYKDYCYNCGQEVKWG